MQLVGDVIDNDSRMDVQAIRDVYDNDSGRDASNQRHDQIKLSRNESIHTWTKII